MLLGIESDFMYIYIFVCLIAIIVVLLLALALIAYHPEEKDKHSYYVHSSKGIDVDSGQRGYDDIYGYRGLNFGTVVDKKYSALKALVFLEECQSRRQYRAEITDEVVIGRIVPGCPDLNDVSVSLSNNVSRRHCRLFEHSGFIFLENMSMVGCTMLNGEKIVAPEIIKVGDLIGISDIQLRVICIQNLVPT